MEKMEVDAKTEEAEFDEPEGDGFDISEKTLRHTVIDVHKLTHGSTSSSKPSDFSFFSQEVIFLIVVSFIHHLQFSLNIALPK